MKLDKNLSRLWLNEASKVFYYKSISIKVEYLLNAYGLRWSLIILNDFVNNYENNIQNVSDKYYNYQLKKSFQIIRRIKLKKTSLDKRSIYLRKLILRGLIGGNRGHIGSSMSLVEILRVLYDKIMKFKPKDPLFEKRDRLIFSKGHGCLALYSILADKKFFSLSKLDSFCKSESLLGGHPDFEIPGVEASTGALGHGASIGVGVALSLKLKKSKSKVFVIIGDGELGEGSNWEAFMYADKYKLNNLFFVIDKNDLQTYGNPSIVFWIKIVEKINF